MRSSVTGLVAAALLLGGVAGCSLPEVLPLAGGTTSGPSPYGPWYEQHWATNSVLLAATDDEGNVDSDDVAAFEEHPGTVDGELGSPEADHDVNVEVAPKNPPAVETNNAPSAAPSDFDESSPYQFPASKYAAPAESAPPPPPAPPPVETVPPPGEPIRY